MIGSLLARECCGMLLRIPFKMYGSLGNDISEGSGRPAAI